MTKEQLAELNDVNSRIEELRLKLLQQNRSDKATLKKKVDILEMEARSITSKEIGNILEFNKRYDIIFPFVLNKITEVSKKSDYFLQLLPENIPIEIEAVSEEISTAVTNISWNLKEIISKTKTCRLSKKSKIFIEAQLEKYLDNYKKDRSFEGKLLSQVKRYLDSKHITKSKLINLNISDLANEIFKSELTKGTFNSIRTALTQIKNS